MLFVDVKLNAAAAVGVTVNVFTAAFPRNFNVSRRHCRKSCLSRRNDENIVAFAAGNRVVTGTPGDDVVTFFAV